MPRVSLVEALGLKPLPLAARQMGKVLFGDPLTPKTRFDLTSLKIFMPRLSVETWLGRKRSDRLIPILNFVNRTPTPVEEGWSVRKTQALDWRGGALTYDSHNGTDFVVPPGTRVCTAAPGVVRAIRREFNRGGLKVYVDHGQALVTTYHHLSRSSVSIGQELARGAEVGLSGASGADSTFMFPWAAPHLHFNVWYAGAAVDPYAAPGEVSWWREKNDPRPADDDAAGDVSGSFDREGVARCRAACRDAEIERVVAAQQHDLQLQGIELLIEAITYPTRFRGTEPGKTLFSEDQRAPWPALDLPFRRDEFDGSIIL
ncbi:MAG: M23 family metallopeptidase [Deltaproteobacteria bacterium]|nr:M23 family metallopeptidase [Deltaproteobacteria bacterium]